MANHRVLKLLFLCFWLLAYVDCRATDRSTSEVLMSVMELRVEVDQIRLALHKEEKADLVSQVFNTQPRHLYSIGQTVFRKANWLAQRIARGEKRSPRPAPDHVAPEDLVSLVADIREEIGKVRLALGLSTPFYHVSLKSDATSNDILVVIGNVGRQLNVIMEREVEWATLYDQLLLALTYVEGALPEDQRHPPMPAADETRNVEDVARKLQHCRQIVRRVGETYGLQVFYAADTNSDEIIGNLSTVEIQDQLSILLSDIAELSLRLNANDLDWYPYNNPNRVMPYHAYQIAQLLEDQLSLLEAGSASSLTTIDD